MRLSIILHGHLLNWPWRSRLERRRQRGRATQSAVSKYLDNYREAFNSISPDGLVSADSGERIFSIWFQGIEQAPRIVKACWRSIRANCSRELVVLDNDSILNWVQLPDYVLEKWRRGLMRPAHFSDICRLDLLYRYGGYWMDATDFAPSELPKWISDEDFFVYMGGDNLKGSYAFVQNCFIRARKGNFLVGAWRDALLYYWKHENSAADYYIHQMIFRKLVECNAEAASQFERMPKVVQDPTHALWFGYAAKPFDRKIFERLCSGAAFQKTEYKSATAQNPPENSFAEVMMNMYQ